MDFFSQTTGAIPLILIGICGILLVFQLYFLLSVYRRLAFYKLRATQDTPASRPLSVIICARNEEENLRRYLPKILEQDYPSLK